LAAPNPEPMLRLLLEQQTSERKLRLLACACCRQVWDLLPDPLSRQAVMVAERYADGQGPVSVNWPGAVAGGEADRGRS